MPRINPQDLGALINELDADLNPQHVHRLPLRSFSNHEQEVVDAYKQGHDSLLGTTKPYAPQLSLANTLRVRKAAQHYAKKQGLSFADVDIPADRYQNSFSHPHELLLAATHLETSFLESIHDIFASRSLQRHNYTPKDFSADAASTTKQLLTTAHKYLAYQLLQLDADYTTAFALRAEAQTVAQRHSKPSFNPFVAYRRWRTKEADEWLVRVSKLHLPPAEVRELADKRFEEHQLLADSIYRRV